MIKAIIFDLNGVFIKGEMLSMRFKKDYDVVPTEFVAALSEIMEEVRKPNAPNHYQLWKKHFKKWNINFGEKEFFSYWFSGENIIT